MLAIKLYRLKKQHTEQSKDKTSKRRKKQGYLEVNKKNFDEFAHHFEIKDMTDLIILLIASLKFNHSTFLNFLIKQSTE